MNRGRVEEERGGKEMDRCPLTVRMVWMWSDMYRDHGEYIWTWLETGEVREWTDVPLHNLMELLWLGVLGRGLC
jgi:hypothetical protein